MWVKTRRNLSWSAVLLRPLLFRNATVSSVSTFVIVFWKIHNTIHWEHNIVIKTYGEGWKVDSIGTTRYWRVHLWYRPPTSLDARLPADQITKVVHRISPLCNYAVDFTALLIFLRTIQSHKLFKCCYASAKMRRFYFLNLIFNDLFQLYYMMPLLSIILTSLFAITYCIFT